MWRSDSSVSSRTGCPPDIVNKEDLTVGESEYPDFRKWNILKISTKSVYDLNWTEKSIFSEYRARTVEQTFSISKTHEKCCLFSKKNINEFLSKKNLKYLHIGLVQVAIKPLTRKGVDASMLMCLRDARFKKFNDSILGMITASLYDGPVYFDCYPDLALALDDPNIIKALTLNILTSGYDMDDGNRPFTLIYRIFYRLLDSQLTPRSRGRDPAGKTMLIQCSTPDAKIQVPKMIQWEDITLPREWTLEQVAPPVKLVFDKLDLTKIAQYTDGTVKIFFDDTKCFPTNKPLRINVGRKSFARFESFVERNTDVDEFLKNNFEPLDLKLKGVASNNSQLESEEQVSPTASVASVNHNPIDPLQDSQDPYSGYNLEKSDRYKTAFTTPFGHYEWNVMPFGLKNAPSEFQNIMNEIFNPFSSHAIVYIDDVLIFSKSLEQHQKYLRAFLHTIKLNGLVVSAPKIKLFQTRVRFLGFDIHHGVIKPIDSAIQFADKFPDEILDKTQL
ncbi:uncharacterized protein LOC142639556 [Castanea sativa]|uniref:uncharacterized protein LOC142639556 n=1 Tax=Castanea sativa TaxID=21020 RepID=UPI003F64F56B